jgi:hypothetical protein
MNGELFAENDTISLAVGNDYEIEIYHMADADFEEY